jgi:hypothetical protein
MVGVSTIDLEGQVFGRLTVVGPAEKRGRYRRWRCKCSCGNRCVVPTNYLRRGSTKSCGCLLRDGELGRARAAKRWSRHGTQLTPRQQRLLAFLQSAELPPTIREMCRHMGVASTNGTVYQLLALERKGYVERTDDRTARRSWRVVRPLPGVSSPAVTLQLIRGALNAGCAEADTLRSVRAIAFEHAEPVRVPDGHFTGQKVSAAKLRLEWTSHREGECTVYQAEVRGQLRRLFGLLVHEWPGQSNWLANGAHGQARTAVEAMRAAEDYALEALTEAVAAFGPAGI